MTIKQYLVVALSLVVAVAASVVLVVPMLGSASTHQAYAWAETQRLDRQVFDQQLDSMRKMHQKMLTARSVETQYALLLDSVPIMRAGVAMMLQMKVDLPATPTGELISSVISKVESERVKDFLALMELLVEMKNDQTAVLNPHRSLIRESAPATTLLKATVPTGMGLAGAA